MVTFLFGGGPYPKDNARVSAYGTVDEACSALGLARAELSPDGHLHDLVLQIQRELFVVGAQLATAAEHWNRLEVGVSRVDQAMLDLKNGRIDVMMSDYIPAQALVGQLGGLEIVYHGVLSSGPMNIVIPNGDAELQTAINDILKQLKDEGFIDTLAVKYFAQ